VSGAIPTALPFMLLVYLSELHGLLDYVFVTVTIPHICILCKSVIISSNRQSRTYNKDMDARDSI
jgi:hypothetical protein